MKKLIGAIVVIGVLIFLVSRMSQSDDAYIQEVEQFWEDKHDFYRTSQASPFVKKEVAYDEVPLFTIDPSYKVNARLEKFTSREIMPIGNSDGTTTRYLKFATAKFSINGQEQQLLILKALGFGHQYLTAFGDDTSGETTYGGGRYLDLVIGKSDQVTIDFNKAYNPYCAYFADFTCPLPPVENLLTVAIEAGEKL